MLMSVVMLISNLSITHKDITAYRTLTTTMNTEQQQVTKYWWQQM